MWTGIDTALAYASGGPPAASSALIDLAGAYRVDLLSGIPLAAHMRDKGGILLNGRRKLLGVAGSVGCRGIQPRETELAAFLDSWRGSERDKWGRCYLALRDRLEAAVDGWTGRIQFFFLLPGEQGAHSQLMVSGM
jgi:hypothetical protein